MKRIIFSIIVAACGALFTVPATSHALSSNSKMFISATNTFYAYVKGGESISASFIKAPESDRLTDNYDVTVTIEGPDVKQKTCIIHKNVKNGEGCSFKPQKATKSGIWRIQFTPPNTNNDYPDNLTPPVYWVHNLYSWNVTVKDSKGKEQHGRAWTGRFALRQPTTDDYKVDFENYYISQDGYIYRAIEYGYNGIYSMLSADAVGVRKGNECVSAYRSVLTRSSDYSAALGACGSVYKLFFEEPSGELPDVAVQWDGTTDWVKPTIKNPSVAELHFVPDDTQDQLSGTVTFYLRNFIGQYAIKIDVDNDGSFDGQNDVTLREQMRSLSDGLQRVHFQGVDKQGRIIYPSQKIGIKIDITNVAEIHFVGADVEGRDGFELVRLNGKNAPTSRMCWNDTELEPISDLSFSTEVTDGRNCPDSKGGIHGWAFGSRSWGNNRFIDDWIYASADLDGNNTITFPEAGQAEQADKKQNILPVVVGVVALIIIIGGVAAAVVFRKNNNNRQDPPNNQPPTPPSPPQTPGELPPMPPSDTPPGQNFPLH